MSAEKLAESLPPLPEPYWPREYFGGVPSGAYTKDQMHAYARAALAAHEAEAKAAPAYVQRTLFRVLPGAIAMGWISDAERKDLEDWIAAAPVNQSPTPAPLTDDDLDKICDRLECWDGFGIFAKFNHRAFARAVIAAANGAKP